MQDVLERLRAVALDLRWTWSHRADALWQRLDAATWERTGNPWALLQGLTRNRLEQVMAEPGFAEELARLEHERAAYAHDLGWYGRLPDGPRLERVAYFCMEFGLGEALPLYAGGLGILAGDYLKAASDMGLPAVGVGLLYQQGYFRQTIDGDGFQHEAYPYNAPGSLPITPVVAPAGGWLRVTVELPGRLLSLRVWQACVGRVMLYLLDSNDLLNSPADRGITGELYGGSQEIRLLQEIVLGIGGWRALEAMGLAVDICHLNEGHAAFAVLERARSYMVRRQVPFCEAWWATRPGNVFTTHTAVASAFDTYEPTLILRYLPYCHAPECALDIPCTRVLGLGRAEPGNQHEPFNMAYLALRGSGATNAVSRLHAQVSRDLFDTLFPGWPAAETPVGHVTNGVHVASWDSAAADRLWERAVGKWRWREAAQAMEEGIQRVGDHELWALRAAGRRDLVEYARQRVVWQLSQRGAPANELEQARRVFDADTLTLGFARRFTEYKRPNLLLHDPARLCRLLADPDRPVQLVVAGKAHPKDAEGKWLIRKWIQLVHEHPEARAHVVFLEDYDIALAQALVCGVDVWINTPRRPWEACGTSGMKVLVNGGLNVSVLDGWWSEAYTPAVGWAVGDEQHHDAGPASDASDAEHLYHLLETEIVPAFYQRDAEGIPRAWVARVRASMARLVPQFSTNRMLREYVERLYRPGKVRFARRSAADRRMVQELEAWQRDLTRAWQGLRFGNISFSPRDNELVCAAQVFLGSVAPEAVRVELYAESREPGGAPEVFALERGQAIADAEGGWLYRGSAPDGRAAEHYTLRVVPHHPEALVPLENDCILWQR
jgi:starch phosphorylase